MLDDDSHMKSSNDDLISYGSSLSLNNMNRPDPKMPHTSAVSFLTPRSVIGEGLLRGLFSESLRRQ